MDAAAVASINSLMPQKGRFFIKSESIKRFFGDHIPTKLQIEPPMHKKANISLPQNCDVFSNKPEFDTKKKMHLDEFFMLTNSKSVTCIKRKFRKIPSL